MIAEGPLLLSRERDRYLSGMPHTRLTFLLLSSAVAAQTTHFVGAGGFPQIRNALAIAASGDVIVVQSGTYAQFDVTVGVTIRALVPGAVTIAYNAAFAPPGCATTPGCPATQGPTRFLVPNGQTAHVVGLRFDGSYTGQVPFVSGRVEVTGGLVTFDQCEFLSTAPVALRIDQAQVHMQHCTATGLSFVNPGTQGVYATQSYVTVVGGSFTGGSIALGSGLAADGLRLDNTFFYGSGFTALGGLSASAQPGLGIRANGGETWVSNASITGGNNTCGLQVPTGLHFARITSAVPACAMQGGGVLGVLRPAPLQIGTTFTLDFRTVPNGFAAVLASQQLTTNDTSGLLYPEPFLDPTGLLDGGLVVANASGSAIASYAVPNSAALVAQTFWFQGITGLTLPLLTSPVVGGLVR